MSDHTTDTLIIRPLGRCDYQHTWDAMRSWTEQRTPQTPDEIWLLEHPPVYTQGPSSTPEQIIAPQNIPIIPIDRGGQVTFHGPGQLVGYTLIDLKRKGLGPRRLVAALENSLIALLKHYDITAYANEKARGVYVNGAKIASIGLRIRKGCSYHGFALNVAMDLAPFAGIQPCGQADITMTQINDFHPTITCTKVRDAITPYLCQNLGHKSIAHSPGAPEYAPIPHPT